MSEHTCIRDDGGTPNRRCRSCDAERLAKADDSARRLAIRIRELPNGTPCLVTRDDGSILHSVTRSDPWELGSGQWVVKVEGISGGYVVERVRKADVEAIHAWLCKIRYRYPMPETPKRCDGTHGGTPFIDEPDREPVRFIVGYCTKCKEWKSQPIGLPCHDCTTTLIQFDGDAPAHENEREFDTAANLDLSLDVNNPQEG